MKIFKFILIIFISISSSIKADSKKTLIDELKNGGKLIFIRHAYAPGGGDPDNFDISDCTTQRNLSGSGRIQSQKIGSFFEKNKILIGKYILVSGVDVKKQHSLPLKNMKQKTSLTLFLVQNLLLIKKSKLLTLINL